MTQCSIEERWKRHIWDSNKRKFERRPLYSAIKMYGADGFAISVIEKCKIELLQEREAYWIDRYDTYKNGYNATVGGDGKAFYDWEAIVESYYRHYRITAVAKEIGCSNYTVLRVLNECCIPRDRKLEFSLRTGNPIVAKKDDVLAAVFPSQLKAAEWIRDQGKTKIKNLKKVSCVIGKAVQRIEHRTNAYGYTWETFDRDEYVKMVKRN